MRHLFSVLIFFAILTHSALAKNSGNGITSSGGDRIAETKDMAWFTGNHQIKTCIEVSANYPYSKKFLEQKISEASLKWKKYYLEHMEQEFQNDKNSNVARPRIAFDLIFETCNPKTELSFLFGKQSDSIKNEIAKNYNDPIGLALLLEYDWNSGTGKGEVWIDNIVKKFGVVHNNAIDSIILHELGHVFGNGHYQNTVMDENIADDLSWMNPNGGYREDDASLATILTSIDKFRYLCFNYSLSWSFKGHWPKKDESNSSELSKEIFEDIIGVNFQTPLEYIELTNQTSDKRVSIKFKINNYVSVIPLTLIRYNETNEEAVSMFKVVTKQTGTNAPLYYSYQYESRPKQVSGRIMGRSGKKYGITLHLNEIGQTIITLNTPDGETLPILIKGDEPKE